MIPSIETLDEHAAAIIRLGKLMASDPAADSFDDREIQDLAERIEEFEKRTFLLDLQHP